MPYSPIYVNLDDVPVRQVPDDYDRSEKEDSLEVAESAIELDVYDGETIPEDKRIPAIIAAIKQKATCELVKGTEDPTSTKLGDLADDGSNKSDYANTFCDRYDELVDKINNSGVMEEESGKVTDPYVYTTEKPE